MTFAPFYTAYEGIVAGVVTVLETATAEAGLLAGVEEIIRGDRARGRQKVPCVYAFPERVDDEAHTGGKLETFNLSIALISVVKSGDPAAGSALAGSLATRARSVVLANSPLGLGYVRDIVSGRFEPTSPFDNEGQHFGALAEVRIKFQTMR